MSEQFPIPIQTRERPKREASVRDALQTTSYDYLGLDPKAYHNLDQVIDATTTALSGLEVKDSALNHPRKLTIAMGIIEQAMQGIADHAGKPDDFRRRGTKRITQQEYRKLGILLAEGIGNAGSGKIETIRAHSKNPLVSKVFLSPNNGFKTHNDFLAIASANEDSKASAEMKEAITTTNIGELDRISNNLGLPKETIQAKLNSSVKFLATRFGSREFSQKFGWAAFVYTLFATNHKTFVFPQDWESDDTKKSIPHELVHTCEAPEINFGSCFLVDLSLVEATTELTAQIGELRNINDHFLFCAATSHPHSWQFLYKDQIKALTAITSAAASQGEKIGPKEITQAYVTGDTQKLDVAIVNTFGLKGRSDLAFTSVYGPLRDKDSQAIMENFTSPKEITEMAKSKIPWQNLPRTNYPHGLRRKDMTETSRTMRSNSVK